MQALLRTFEADARAEAGWARLLVEFRTVALRDRDLSRRYAVAHRRTVELLADVMERLHTQAGLHPVLPPRSIAEAILALGVGITLERAADPAALPWSALSQLVLRGLGFPPVGARERSRPRKVAPLTFAGFRDALQAELLARCPSTSSASGGAPTGSRHASARGCGRSSRTPSSARRSTPPPRGGEPGGRRARGYPPASGDDQGGDDGQPGRRVHRSAAVPVGWSSVVSLATTREPVPILGRYVALGSGGSSGQRGVFVSDRDALVEFLAALIRPLMKRLLTSGGPPAGGLRIAMVAAASAVHATGSAPAFTAGERMPFQFLAVPVTLPLAEIVARLNALQPSALAGYPSSWRGSRAERRAGRLRIAPMSITSTSETLLPALRAAISDGFGVPVVDTFGSTEGLVGVSDPDDPVLAFNSDSCIVELVDDRNRPVAPGARATKVLLTNLSNRVQPLIRYEMHDDSYSSPRPRRAAICGPSSRDGPTTCCAGTVSTCTRW